MWRGVLYSLLLLLFASMQTILLSQYFYRMYLVGMWSKSALISAIYRYTDPLIVWYFYMMYRYRTVHILGWVDIEKGTKVPLRFVPGTVPFKSTDENLYPGISFCRCILSQRKIYIFEIYVKFCIC
jgi:hypothetical protein